MAFTTSGGSRTYLKYADFDEGDVLVTGFYVGEETSKFKNQLYVFNQLENDAIVCLNSTGKLKKWIEDKVNTGDLVRITYMGKKIIASGMMAGKEAHDFKFEIDLDHRAKYEDAKAGKTAAPVVSPVTAVFKQSVQDAIDDGTL